MAAAYMEARPEPEMRSGLGSQGFGLSLNPPGGDFGNEGVELTAASAAEFSDDEFRGAA